MVTETRTRQSPEFEAAQEQYIDLLTKQVGRAPGTGGVPTLAQLGPQVAAVDPLTQAAQQQAATQAGLGQLTFDPTTGAVTGVGTGTGVAGFQPFLDQAQQFQTAAAGLTGPTAFQQLLSPYQQQVIDATLRDFDKQAAVDRARTLQQAGMGTVGNLDAGRFGVQLAEQGAQSNLDRAALQARLLQSGFTQASDLASRAQQQQLGLGEFSRGLASLQPSLASSTQQQLGGAGTGALAFQQALLDAEQQRQQLAYQEPLSRIQALGSGLASQVGGVPTTTQTLGTPAPQASPLSQALQVGLTAYGLGSLFGRG